MSVVSTPNPTSVVFEDDARRKRAKERIYVICQTIGWGSFLALNLIFFAAMGRPAGDQRPAGFIISSVIIVSANGLLITHFSRRLLTRWGWKQLGWRQLIPRLLAFAAGQSAIRTALGTIYSLSVKALTSKQWDAPYSLGSLLFISWGQGLCMMCGWLCVYFFYNLFDRYNRLHIEQARLATHVKEAELRALKSQVNPHFIFNSLNSLRALIDENPARARQAVTQLANLLRYSLQSAQAETVAFEDELRVVNDYLALEQVRHEERLRVRLDIDPATLALPVPPLLLQTLVENAVKYGISVRPEGGEIVIIARCEDGQLHLSVINPGELAPSNATAPGTTPTSTGVGLRNAAARLRMFFGEDARLQLRAEADSRVVAEVFIPVHAASRV